MSEEYTSIGKKYWNKAGVSEKIDLRIAPAVDTLQSLLDDNQTESFDFVYIDADKMNYLNYYKLSSQLVRPGGFIFVDNVLWQGAVADPNDNDEATVAIREVNEYIKNDQTFDISLLTIGDGVFICRKK